MNNAFYLICLERKVIIAYFNILYRNWRTAGMPNYGPRVGCGSGKFKSGTCRNSHILNNTVLKGTQMKYCTDKCNGNIITIVIIIN